MSGQTKLMLPAGGSLTVAATDSASNNTMTFPAATDTVVGVAATQTLTNKTLESPIISSSGITFSDATVQTTAFYGVGVGQTWQTVSRSFGTTYTNSTGKPIMVNTVVGLNPAGGGIAATATASVSSVTVGIVSLPGLQSFILTQTLSFIVPAGATYAISIFGTVSLSSWAELR